MADSIIAVAGLTKRFGPVLAVDGLDFSVDQGEVCGMLGPNGAGKTTTLRMLVGLIFPDAGEARLLGHNVRPGDEALRRVGVMIEESAFVPYLNGITNLRLWWEAGGAPWSDADVETALSVAGLGDAVRRKVKTYSQGMKQRLGIARALLSRPDVLVLDEPTSGLDPGEMREVRQLLRRVSEQGTTVLLSSHLLSEVEQVCTNAVVMDKGKLVASGAVAELIGAGGSVYIEVTNVRRATSTLKKLKGVRRVIPEPPGLAVELDGIKRSEVVAALVHAGVGVETVTARHQLEDAFLGLVGEA
ncbi:MAG: ABC transporter ATP-binding protein [Acidimicrobiia bacterium]|nr:ABC transporter ATP-binding protein [Acidimicrobiia bacterium]MBV9042398.1 ABC transporter ATP-binding protein [Acidimicrobiia bacterium]